MRIIINEAIILFPWAEVTNITNRFIYTPKEMLEWCER